MRHPLDLLQRKLQGSAEEWLFKSIEMNGLQNIKLYRAAVSNENKMVSMMLWDRRNSGFFHLLNDPNLDREIYHVEGKRLDDVLENEHVDLIKIDVEGAEGLVFQGMIKTIEKDQPLMIMEYTPLSLSDISKMSGESLLKAFEDLDYSFQDVESFNGEFIPKRVQELSHLLRKRNTGHLDLILFPNVVAGSSKHVVGMNGNTK